MSIDASKILIYNSYLKALSDYRGQEFFQVSDLSQLNVEDLEYLEKLFKFFKSHSHINIDIFMRSPYKVFTIDKEYSLKDFCEPMALKTYFLYLAFLDEKSADAEDNISLIKDGLIFIKNFCIEKDIPLKQYLNYAETATYEWCVHLLENKISIYNILGFSFFGINIYLLLNQMPEDVKGLFLDQYHNNIQEYLKKLKESEKAKKFILKGYKRISKKITEERVKKNQIKVEKHN